VGVSRLEEDKDEPAIIYNVACAYSLLGDHDQALALLDVPCSEGYGHQDWPSTIPIWQCYKQR
jgi:hypothetical protein